MGQPSSVLNDEERGEKVKSLYGKYKYAFPSVEDVTPEEALKLHEQKQAVFVDVRQQEEQEVSAIPGSLTHEEALDKVDELKKDGQHVVVYCTIGYRSGKFAQKLGQLGVHALNIQGGILGWTLAGGKVVDPSGHPTEELHVYGGTWDFAPTNYKTHTFSLSDQVSKAF